MNLSHVKTSPDRNTYFDVLRGAAIIGVVGIHTIPSAIDYNSLMGFLMVALRQFIGCSVPLFVAISGYFLGRKKIGNWSTYFHFLKDRLLVIYFPMLIWSFPDFMMRLGDGGSALHYMMSWLTGNIHVFYFVMLIMECYMVLPLLTNINMGGGVVVFISALFVTLFTYMNHFGHENIPMIVYGSLPSFIGFFSLGCYAGQCGYDISLPKILLLIFIMLGWSVAETYWFHDYGNPSRALGFKLSVQSYSFVLIVFLLSKNIIKLSCTSLAGYWLAQIGCHSFTIYLTHMLVLHILNICGLTTNFWLVDWTILLIVDLFVVKILTFIPIKVHRYLGIR